MHNKFVSLWGGSIGWLVALFSTVQITEHQSTGWFVFYMLSTVSGMLLVEWAAVNRYRRRRQGTTNT